MGTTVGSSTKTLHLHCVGTIIFSLSFDSIFLLTIFYFLLALLLSMARLLCYEQIIWLFVRSFCHLICYGYVYLLAARFIYVIKFRFFFLFLFLFILINEGRHKANEMNNFCFVSYLCIFRTQLYDELWDSLPI